MAPPTPSELYGDELVALATEIVLKGPAYTAPESGEKPPDCPFPPIAYEEAVELILKGPVWIACWLCLGSGRDETGRLNSCRVCDGDKTIVSTPYRQACTMLGRPIPRAPSTTIGFEAFEEIAVSVINPNSIKRLYIK